MKKILILLLAFYSLHAYTQTPIYDDLDVYGSTTMRKDAFVNDSIRTPKINVDTLRFGDGSTQTTAGGGGGTDSALYADTSAYAVIGARTKQRICVRNDTVITDKSPVNILYCVITEEQDTNIVITLPDLNTVNIDYDFKELQFKLANNGTYTLEGFGSQTIDGQSNLTNTVSGSAITLVPTSDSTWTKTQDSRGGTEGQIRFYPINELSGIETYYKNTFFEDSLSDTETIISTSAITTNVLLYAWVTDTNIFDDGQVTGGNAVLRQRIRGVPAGNDAAEIFVAIYKRDELGNELLINDSTNLVDVPFSDNMQYVNYETSIIDYTYASSDRFVFKVFANGTSSPTVNAGIEGNLPTYYTRAIDPAIIRLNVGAAGQSLSSQYNLNGVLAGDSDVMHYDDSLDVTKKLVANELKVKSRKIESNIDLSWATPNSILIGLNDTIGTRTNFKVHASGISFQSDTTLFNVSLGYQAGEKINSLGAYNSILGYQACGLLTAGDGNVAIGSFALTTLTTGSTNIGIGNRALNSLSTGSNNIGIGNNAGYNALGSGNIFIGFEAGINETGSNTLYIDNSSTSNPLIYGDFSNDSVGINADLHITGNLTVDGTYPGGGGLTSPLDTLTINDSINLNGGIKGQVNTETFATTKTISFASQHFAQYTVTGTTTITISNIPDGTSPELHLLIDATGGHTVTFSGATKATGTADIDNTASKVNLIQFKKINGTVYWFNYVVN